MILIKKFFSWLIPESTEKLVAAATAHPYLKLSQLFQAVQISTNWYVYALRCILWSVLC